MRLDLKDSKKDESPYQLWTEFMDELGKDGVIEKVEITLNLDRQERHTRE